MSPPHFGLSDPNSDGGNLCEEHIETSQITVTNIETGEQEIFADLECPDFPKSNLKIARPTEPVKNVLSYGVSSRPQCNAHSGTRPPRPQQTLPRCKRSLGWKGCENSETTKTKMSGSNQPWKSLLVKQWSDPRLETQPFNRLVRKFVSHCHIFRVLGTTCGLVLRRSGYSFSLSLVLFSSRKSRKSCALSKSFIHCS